jgi:hippurate hydrolase
MLQSSILKLANEYAPDTIAIRHHLHAHPELSYQEFETSAFIQNQLQQL